MKNCGGVCVEMLLRAKNNCTAVRADCCLFRWVKAESHKYTNTPSLSSRVKCGIILCIVLFGITLNFYAKSTVFYHLRFKHYIRKCSNVDTVFHKKWFWFLTCFYQKENSTLKTLVSYSMKIMLFIITSYIKHSFFQW